MKKVYFFGILAIFAILFVFAGGSVFAQNYNYYNYGPSCNYHAYRDCVGSAVYWFDSCANRQDFIQNCSGYGQTCQYGQCAIIQPVYNDYVAHYSIRCYGKSLYWFDSLGASSGLYKSCSDSNVCTQDSCASGKCSNILKCDGSTCATGSADFNKYCAPSQPDNPIPDSNTNPNQNQNTGANINGLVVSFFAKQDASSNQWQKNIQVGQNNTVYFMISVANNSATQIDNVNISANIPNEISSLGNLQINGVAVSGDIVSGISVGSLSPANAKTITFEGKTQTFSAQGDKQAIASAKVSGVSQTDSIAINLNPGAVQASVSSPASSASSGFWEFLKRWYLWILVGLVLIFLFVVVFRRLSSNA